MTKLRSECDPAGVRVLTLDDPGRRNALSLELITDLATALQECSTAAGTRCVILTGSGPAFCSGLALDEVAAAPTDEVDTTPLWHLLERLRTLPCPTIAALNGPAVAGGATLALACDLAIASASARLGFPGIRQGLVPPVVMPSLLEAVGPARARDLILTGRLIDAHEMLAWALVKEVVPDERVLDRAHELARALVEIPPVALREAKQLLAKSAALLREGNDNALAEFAGRMPLSADARAALHAPRPR
jgi:methylglutaconyl-CoA hydratase